MRKLFWSGTALILATAIVCLGIGSRGGWYSSSRDQDPDVAYDENYVLPEEPQLAAALPEQPLPIEGPQEVINVLEAQLSSLRNKELAAAQDSQPLPEPNVPVVFEPDDSAYRIMPPCTEEDDLLPARMPYASDTTSGPMGATQLLLPSKLRGNRRDRRGEWDPSPF